VKSSNPRLAKLHRAYTTEQAARLFGVHRNTVRAWIKAGLPTVAGRPALIEGRELRAFLERRSAAAKRPCPPGTLYCCKCRVPRAPVPHAVVFEAREHGAGSLRAICVTCGTRMFQRARQERLGAVIPGIVVLIVKAPARIAECPPPSPNRA
jgi:excisionase family DNA binding protein